MMLPMKELKGQISPNNLTGDKNEKDNYNGIDDDTAKIFLVGTIYVEVQSKHELSQNSHHREIYQNTYQKKETET